MNKLWQLAPKIREDFIKKFPDYDRVILQLLHNRGLREREEIELFLSGRYEDNFNPFLFKEMVAAIDLVIKHVKEGKKICIYGDYDADGITSSALLYEVLTILRADCFVIIPDRRADGYGGNKSFMDKIIKQGASLIITVDGGIRNKEEIAYAKSAGLEVVVTDHHEPPEDSQDFPDCLIVNPHMRGEKYPFKFLAGVGVAFKFAQALLEKSTLKKEDQEKILGRVLDLLAVGTVADCVALLGENRLLLKKGLEALNSTKRIGLKELIKKAKIDGKELEAWNIGFQIAPRLNASSRISSANNAFNLLITKDKKIAEEEAECLNERNIRRQKETEEVVMEVEEQIKKQLDEKIIIGLCPEKDKVWNEGVIGLVSGRVTEKYYKPSLIITKTDKGYKGSGRSIEGFNLFKAIEECGDLLAKHGGHPMACGFNVSASNLPLFIEKIRKIVKRDLAEKEMEAKISVDLEISLEDVDRGLWREIKKMQPFGQSNPEPKFLLENARVTDVTKMGADGRHIKFRFNSFWGLGFNRAEEWKDFKIGDFVDLVFNLDENEFNGQANLQFKIIDMKVHGEAKIRRGHWQPDPIYID